MPHFVITQFSKLSPDIRYFSSLDDAKKYKKEMLETGIYNSVVLDKNVDPYNYLLKKMGANNFNDALDFIDMAKYDADWCERYR